MRGLWTALAALGLCGLAAAAPLGSGAAGAMPASDEEAAPAEARSGAEETGIGAAEPAAVPAGTRAVLEKVLDRMDLMRAELAELKAEKRRSDERARRLSERVDGLEMRWGDGDTLAKETEWEAANDQPPFSNDTVRHRKQAGPAACGPSSWAARTPAVSCIWWRRAPAGAGGDLPAAGHLPVGGVRGGVPAVHEGLRHDALDDAGRPG